MGAGNRLGYLSEKHLVMYLSIALDVLEHCPNKGLQVTLCSHLESAELTDPEYRPLRQEASLCRLDSFSAEHS